MQRFLIFFLLSFKKFTLNDSASCLVYFQMNNSVPPVIIEKEQLKNCGCTITLFKLRMQRTTFYFVCFTLFLIG